MLGFRRVNVDKNSWGWSRIGRNLSAAELYFPSSDNSCDEMVKLYRNVQLFHLRIADRSYVHVQISRGD